MRRTTADSYMSRYIQINDKITPQSQIEEWKWSDAEGRDPVNQENRIHGKTGILHGIRNIRCDIAHQLRPLERKIRYKPFKKCV